MLFFKQKTAYEMRISDWSSDVALPICDFFRRRWYVILHQRTHVDAIRRGLGVTRLLGGDRQDLIVIEARRQIDVAGQPPEDRKSGVMGKGGSVRGELGGGRIIKRNKHNRN